MSESENKNGVDVPEEPQNGAAGEPESADQAAKTPESAEQAPEAAETQVVRDGMNWYVLRVASNKEARVRDALERKIKIEKLSERVNQVLVPTQKEKRMRGGTARIYKKKLYPGYVFVEMAPEKDGSVPEDVWFVIKETDGVGDFISSGGKPSPMPVADVEAMLASTRESEETPALANLNFQKDDRVKITEGAFENFEGTVDEINTQKGTVRVIATIFGRATPVDIEYWQVEKL